MRKKILLYTSVLAFFGACSIEEIQENFNLNSNGNVITTTTETCENLLSAAYGYNAFVQNGTTIQSGDTEGPIAIGGDLTIAGTFTVATQSAGIFFHNNEDLAASLVVNGQTNYENSQGITLNQGYIKLGDLTGSTVYDLDNNNVATNTRITPGDYNETPRILLQRNQELASLDAPSIIDFDTAFAELNEASAAISELDNNIEIENGNKITLAEDVINVLNLTGEELNGLTNFTFNNQPSTESPLIINVDNEGEFVWKVQNQAGIGDQHGAFIIYNFYNTSKLTIESGTSIMGSVLAPSTDVIKASSDNINGQVIAKSYVHQNGELHHHPFTFCYENEEEEEEEEEECSLTIELIEESDSEGTFISVESTTENLTYEWSTGSTNSSIFIFTENTTTYTVIATDEDGCTATESITIEVEEEECALTVDLIEENDGEGYTIEANSEEENLTYEWSTGSNNSSIYVYPESTTTYTVTVTNENGCTATDTITIIPAPEEEEEEDCSISAELISEFDGEGTLIYVKTTEENLTYEWSTGSTNPSIYVFPFRTTTYTVDISNGNGCTITESITIEF